MLILLAAAVVSFVVALSEQDSGAFSGGLQYVLGTVAFQNRFFHEPKLNGAAFISVALMLFVLFVPPVTDTFGLIRLSAQFYGVGLGLSLVSVPALELVKALGLIAK